MGNLSLSNFLSFVKKKEIHMAVYLTQRFYEEKLPKVNEIVITKVTRLDQMGVYCKLVEYGDIEGYIPTPELSQVRVRKINHITKIGKQEIAVVLRVDKEKGFYLIFSFMPKGNYLLLNFFSYQDILIYQNVKLKIMNYKKQMIDIQSQKLLMLY